MNHTGNKIIKLLRSVKREGMLDLIIWLEDNHYFTQKASSSSRFHGAYEGGLADHSYNVLKLFSGFNTHLGLKINREALIICSLLHDLCKCHLYDNNTYQKSEFAKGHGKYSVELIKEHMFLTEQEEHIIRYHMGFYGSISYYNEYPFKDALKALDNKITKLFHMCDDLAAQFKDK